MIGAVPGYLMALPRWIFWRKQQRIDRRTGEATETKVPIAFRTGKPCDVSDPHNWVDHAAVESALIRTPGAWDGPGFVLGHVEQLGEYLIGLDLDSCIDNDGDLADWALPFLAAMSSFTEVSHSGSGLHVVARIRAGDLAAARQLLGIQESEKDQARTRTFGDRRNGAHAPGAQLFLMKRYFAVTGKHWATAPEDVMLLTLDQIAALAEAFGPKQAPGPGSPKPPDDDDEAEPDEAALRDKLGAASRRNPRLKERWEGSTEGLDDRTRSAFDMSLGGMLKAAGFSKSEMIALLQLHESLGLGPERINSIADRRYYDRLWNNSKAMPRIEPEPPPDWESQHPPADEDAAGRTKPPWPEPIDFFTPLVTSPAEVTAGEAPPALWPFISDTAGRMGVAASTVTLATIITCAAVISDEWRLQPKRHDHLWTENARLWGAIVGPPSILKTPIINACTRPIDRLESEARKRWQEDMERHRKAHAAWRKRDDPDEPEPRPPKRERRLVESTTIEALQEVLRDDGDARFTAPAGKVLVRQDELSEFLANLDRYSNSRQGGDRGAYLRLYNGGPFTVDRVGRGAFTASNWSGCLLGGIQPEVIQRIAKQTVDDGLLQRMTYDVPPPQAERGADRKPDRDALDRYHRLIPALAALRPSSRRDGCTHAVVLHADAHAHREAIDELAQDMGAMPDVSTRLQSALGKWPGLFARLCLTFHLIGIAAAKARGEMGPPEDVLPAAVAERVARYMRRILLPQLLRADALMFATVQTGHAKWIAGHILAHALDRITTRDVLRVYRPLSAPECRTELAEVMAGLVSIGWLDPEPPRNPLNPVAAWRVNPLVHTMFADRAQRECQHRRRHVEDIRRRMSGT
jgi:hypothetical protein